MTPTLMNPRTGSTDSAENWEAEGFTPDNSELYEVVEVDGQWVEYAAVLALMDDAVRESLHDLGTFDDAQSFVNAYAAKHAEMFGEDFEVG